jgi:hypothetical protein
MAPSSRNGLPVTTVVAFGMAVAVSEAVGVVTSHTASLLKLHVIEPAVASGFDTGSNVDPTRR